MNNRALPPCDCTVYCGDDPWIKSGRASYCQPFLDRQAFLEAQLKRQKALDALPEKLLASLKNAENFMAGFEDDDVQEGINDLLTSIRKTICEAELLL